MKKKSLLAVVLSILLVFALTACSGGDAGGSTGNSAGGDSTSADGGGGGADEILIGYAGPLTGAMSIFMAPTPWVQEWCLDVINNENGGIEIDGKKIPVRVIYADTESDSNKAVEAATKLVTDDKVDILIGGWTPVQTNTVSAVGERYQVPTFVFGAPEESWLEGGPYEWSTGMNFNYDLMADDVLNMWNKLDTNKKVGYVFDTDVDGTVGREMYNNVLEGTDYEVFDPGPYTVGTTDFTSLISKLKDADCDIVTADMITPDFNTFWKQCHQYGYVPKVCTINKGMHYEADVEALGDGTGEGLTLSALWDKNYPYASTLLDMNCEEIADKYEEENGGFYPYSIGYDVAMYDMLFDALTRAGTLDKDTLLAAMLETDIDTVFGNLKFNENRCMQVPAIGTQWVPSTQPDKYEFEKVVVASSTFPGIPEFDPFIIPDTTQD